MVYYTKVKGGVWAQIEHAGMRLSKTLPTKAEAWAVPEEAEIMAGERNQFPRRSLRKAVKRYQLAATDKKAEKKPKVARADNLRFEAWLRDYPELANNVFCESTGDDQAAWRDARRKVVSESSVLGEAQQ